VQSLTTDLRSGKTPESVAQLKADIKNLANTYRKTYAPIDCG
jgi:hypothetical protein